MAPHRGSIFEILPGVWVTVTSHRHSCHGHWDGRLRYLFENDAQRRGHYLPERFFEPRVLLAKMCPNTRISEVRLGVLTKVMKLSFEPTELKQCFGVHCT